MVYLGTSATNGTANKNSNGTPALALTSAASGSTSSTGGHLSSTVDLSSRSPSHKDQDSASDDEREGRIRVGKDYQINPTNFIQIEDRKMEQCPERALLVWSPAPQLSAGKLDEYIQVAKEKFGYNAEQALGMLFWHKHDLDRALQDLANFTPFPDEWSVEDKVLFEQAFQFHGKSFHRIRQMLPDKTIAQLVKYYYSWKKTRTRTSLMDRQARKLQVNRESAATATPGADEPVAESDNDEDKESQQKPKCFNCGILCHVTHPTPKGQMCGTCHQYYTRTGKVRPTTGPIRKDGTKSKHSLFKNSNKPPKGMYVNHDDLVALATGPHPQGEALLKSMDREIVSYKRNVQNNKQNLSDLQSRSRGYDVAPYRIPSKTKASGDDAASSPTDTASTTNNDAPTSPNSTINAKWTNDELNLGVQGIRTLGKNFKVIAEIIGTKTESHVRSFFVNYRRRYNLDAALKEYEAVNGPSPADEDDSNSNNSSGSKTADRETKESASDAKTNGSAVNSATVTPSATPTTSN